jgi:hypothetical protein
MRRGNYLVGLVSLTVACAAPRTTSEPAPRQIVQWTAATNRIDWIPADASPDSSGLTPGMRTDLPRDFMFPPRFGTPVGLMGVPSTVRGSSTTFLIVVDEHGRLERLTFLELPNLEYCRRVVEVFRRMSYEPAFKSDGTPTRGVTQMRFQF